MIPNLKCFFLLLNTEDDVLLVAIDFHFIRKTSLEVYGSLVTNIPQCLQNIIIICYIYKALFWVLKVLYIEGGGGGRSPHPLPVCSIHLDDVTAAIVHQNALHTPATGGEETVMKSISAGDD